MSDLQDASPLASDLAGLVVGIISDVDGLCSDLKARQHGLSGRDPAWNAIMAMRLKAATLRATAWNATAVITALRVGMRTDAMPAARPCMRHVAPAQPCLPLDGKSRGAGERDDGEEERS